MRALLFLLALFSVTTAPPAAGQRVAAPVSPDPCPVLRPPPGEPTREGESARRLRHCHAASVAVGSVADASAAGGSRGASRLAETLDRRWSWPDAAWENDTRSTYTYSETGPLAELAFDAWEAGVWTTDSRYLYGYDAAGRRAELVSQRWEAAAWTNLSRLVYAYDADDRLTVLIIQTWRDGAWANVYRYTSTYGAEGRLTGDLVQQWSGADWTNQYRFSYAYDDAGHRSHDLFQTWTDGSWRDNSQNFFVYYPDDRLAEDLYQRWDGTEWRNNDRRLYGYDVEGYDTEVVSQQWIAVDTLGTTYDWDYTGRNLIAFNEAGSQTENLFQLRQWDGGSWVDNSRKQTVYDADGDPVEDLEQDWDLSTWLNRSQRLYTYQAPTAHDGPPPGAVLTVAPNPASGPVTVRFSLPGAGGVRLTLHDGLGRTIATLFEGAGGAGAASVAALPAGTYWVRVASDGRHAVQRFTVVR